METVGTLIAGIEVEGDGVVGVEGVEEGELE